MVKLEDMIKLQKKAQDQIRRLVRDMIEMAQYLNYNGNLDWSLIFLFVWFGLFALLIDQEEDVAEAQGQKDTADRRHQHLQDIVSQLESRWTHTTLSSLLTYNKIMLYYLFENISGVCWLKATIFP